MFGSEASDKDGRKIEKKGRKKRKSKKEDEHVYVLYICARR